jgi:hypothetical protein
MHGRDDAPMSAAIVQVRMPRIRETAGARRTMPKITLQRTATGWGRFDEQELPVFEAHGTGGRRACLQRAFVLGVVRLRAGEEPHV